MAVQTEDRGIMNSFAEPTHETEDGQVDVAAFYVGEMHLGIDIRVVREINRIVAFTPVPHSPPQVRGVINLRGEVVTVMDLRVILGLGTTEISKNAKNVIVQSDSEQVGLLVDRIGDTICVPKNAIEPVPANMRSADAELFKGVCRMGSELVVILDVEMALADNVLH